MESMSFVCDYALIDPITLAYKVDCIDRSGAFATYRDIDEDSFQLCVFPVGTVIPTSVVTKITEIVNPYLLKYYN